MILVTSISSLTFAFTSAHDARPLDGAVLGAIVGGVTGTSARNGTPILTGAFEAHFADGRDKVTSYFLRLPTILFGRHSDGTKDYPSVVGYRIHYVAPRGRKKEGYEFKPIILGQ